MKAPTRFRVALLLVLVACASIGATVPRRGEARPSEQIGALVSSRMADGSVVIESTPSSPTGSPSGKQELTVAGPPTDIATLDPALVREADASFIDRQIFSGLIRFNDNLEPTPDLAERVQISADGLTYLFHLKSSAAFQNGDPISASDVAFSLSRAVSPKTAGGELSALGGPTFLNGIEGYDEVSTGDADLLSGVVVEGERDVTIKLASPDSTFLMKLACTPASIVDPNDVGSGGEWWTHPNASGPFKVAEYAASNHMTLAPNDHYAGGAPTLTKLTVLLGSNALSPFNLYQSGKVDIADVGISGIDRVLAPDAGYLDQLRTSPLFSLNFIVFDARQAPMDDPEIRKALVESFPSARVASVTYNGHVTAATGIVPDGMLGANWPATVAPFDPAAAKEAIAKSRYGTADKVPPIVIYVAGGGTAEALRDSVAENSGLKIEVISMEWPDFIAGLSSKSLPGYELNWTADYPDPGSLLTLLFGTGRPDNYSNYSNPKMDALLDQAAKEINPADRIALYRQAQQLLMDDNVVIPILFDVGYTLVNPAVKGLTITPMGIMSLSSVWMEH